MDATCSTLFRLANDGCRTCKILKTAIESLYRVENPSKTRFEFRVWKVGNEEDDCQDNVWIYPGFNLWETGGPTIGGIDLYRIATVPMRVGFMIVHSGAS